MKTLLKYVYRNSVEGYVPAAHLQRASCTLKVDQQIELATGVSVVQTPEHFTGSIYTPECAYRIRTSGMLSTK